MKCPVCIEPDLVMTDRQGVEIDYCPKCRGVWLDRGELDKVIERSTSIQAPQVAPDYRGDTQGYSKHDDHRDDHGKYDKHGQQRKKSWLSEMFD
ncbi:MAG: zf-TFIIB domain-containing protein [Verrucomicrobiota bacterium]